MEGWRDGETKRNGERNRWVAWVHQFKVRPGAEMRHQICKVPLRKRAFTEHIAKKMSDKQQSHPLRRLLPPFRGKKMISSETKREMKAKDDKMLTLERYFESCGRDLSRCLSWTK